MHDAYLTRVEVTHRSDCVDRKFGVRELIRGLLDADNTTSIINTTATTTISSNSMEAAITRKTIPFNHYLNLRALNRPKVIYSLKRRFLR